MNNKYSRGFLFAALLYLNGCAYVQSYISDVNAVPLGQEAEIGGAFSGEIAKEMEIVNDPVYTKRVQSIGQKLAAQVPHPDFPYRFYVVNNKVPNAFTIPGGHIYVHTGLFTLVQDDSELAGVIAHELGHAIERHPTKNLTRAYGAEYLTRFLTAKGSGPLQTMTLQLLKTGILTRYSREDELEADEIGYWLSRRAGFSADGLERFLSKLAKMETHSTLSALTSTHPPSAERVARLQELRKDAGFLKMDLDQVRSGKIFKGETN